ncbi:MAG: NAD(P)-dependent alcohol dehydrogenase [Gemmatimonadetes bacterium]|nr:NAD(P)-dependent alcohol dehydrogenase [Gemmatimonadota bacterium]
MMNVRGYAARSSDSPLAPWGVYRRDPGERDVRIQIQHCGICHSDIHFARNEWHFTTYPAVPGHEIIGKVIQVGSGVTRHRAGDLVGVGCFVNSCRSCVSCKEGQENFCEGGLRMTFGSFEADGKTPTYGGYATEIVVDEHFVLKIPKTLDPAAAAPLLCAGITTYSPLKYVGLSEGQKIAVVGLGGLGHMAVKLAASFGAEVTVLSRSSSKQGDAERLGATDFVLTRNEGALRPLAGRFDFILDTISAAHDINGPLGCLKRDGTLILVGAPADPLPVAAFRLLGRRRSILGSNTGGIRETQEMLDHCGAHGITSDIERIVPDQINEAYERTLQSDVKYRFVIDCTKF